MPLNKSVVQSFRHGSSSRWNDEAWSYNRKESERHLVAAKHRNPELKWRLITRRGNEVLGEGK